MKARWMGLILCGLPTSAWASACAPVSAHPAKTVQAMYSAAMAGDKRGMLATFAPDFYAFDGGRRYSGTELAELVDTLKATHRTMTWSVNASEEQVVCDVALITWDNRGTSTDINGTKNLEWLESAVERWQGGTWKLVFFHSTLVPPGT